MRREVASDFIGELQSLDGANAWIIGDVMKGDRKARIVDTVQIVEVQ